MMPTLQWVGYCVLVSGVLALGAVAFEGAARASGRGGRWGWAAALLCSVVIPIVSYLRPVHVAATSGGALITAATFSAAPGAAPIARSAAVNPGIALWLIGSVVVLSIIVLSYVRLVHARKTWELSHVQGVPVWLSYDVGPAALGVVNADIVLPRWVLSLEERALRLMMLHEREHLRAWDPRLMLASLLLVAVMPWNPLVWVMVRRLRVAIELDCDARVLRHAPDPARYGAVLLEVSRHRAAMNFAMSTFAEPRSQMEERIRRMTEWPGNIRFARAAALCALAFTMTGAAYAVRVPVHARVIADIDPVTNKRVAQPVEKADTTSPRMLNQAEVRAATERVYPPLLRDAGVGGMTTLMVYVNASGKPTRYMVYKTSGYDALDAAAIKVAPQMSFSPAIHKGRRVAHWTPVEVPFGMQANSADTTMTTFVTLEPPQPPEVDPALLRLPTVKLKTETPLKVLDVPVRPAPAPPPSTSSVARQMAETSDEPPLSAAPVFTPMTVVPKLLNQAEVEKAVIRFYPPLLRDAGIGGKTKVWFFIDENGTAQKWMVNTPSGYDALDAAALKVAPVLRFTPAMNQDRKVPVWVAIDIMFKVS